MNGDDDSSYVFIQGVFIRDCKIIENMLEERLNLTQFNDNDEETDMKKTSNYEKNPSIFTDISLWATSTSLLCWYCDRSFNNPPVFIPKLVTSINSTIHYTVEGNFCSFNCAYKHLLMSEKDHNARENKTQLLKFLFKLFNGFFPRKITIPPDKTIQTQYSGSSVSSVEYYKMIDDCIVNDLQQNNKL